MKLRICCIVWCSMSSKTVSEIPSKSIGTESVYATISYRKKEVNGNTTKYATLVKAVRFIFFKLHKSFPERKLEKKKCNSMSFRIVKNYANLIFFFFHSKFFKMDRSSGNRNFFFFFKRTWFIRGNWFATKIIPNGLPNPGMILIFLVPRYF